MTTLADAKCCRAASRISSAVCTGRRLERRRARDQHHLGAATERGGRRGVAHLAGGSVREVADGVYRLAGGPGGDEDALAGQIALRSQGTLHGLDEGGHFG